MVLLGGTWKFANLGTNALPTKTKILHKTKKNWWTKNWKSPTYAKNPTGPALNFQKKTSKRGEKKRWTGWWFQIFLFSPRTLGEDEPILTSIFFKGVFQPPTGENCWVATWSGVHLTMDSFSDSEHESDEREELGVLTTLMLKCGWLGHWFNRALFKGNEWLIRWAPINYKARGPITLPFAPWICFVGWLFDLS